MEVIGRRLRIEEGTVQAASVAAVMTLTGRQLTCAGELHPPVNTEHRGEAPSRTAAPVVDAVVVGPGRIDHPHKMAWDRVVTPILA